MRCLASVASISSSAPRFLSSVSPSLRLVRGWLSFRARCYGVAGLSAFACALWPRFLSLFPVLSEVVFAMSGLCGQHQLIGSTFPFERKSRSLRLSSGLALVYRARLRCSRGLKATVCAPMVTHALFTIPGSIRGRVCDVWPLARISSSAPRFPSSVSPVPLTRSVAGSRR